MKATRNCKACARPFAVDHRNGHHQAYCPDAECQRQRRTEAQKRRRTTHVTKAALDSAGVSSRLRPEVKLTEADWYAEHPMIIGLISMLTGSTDLEEIKTVCRKLGERGRNILGHRLGSDVESIIE